MPVVDIEIVDYPEAPPGLAAALAEACGQIFNSCSSTTWVRLRGLSQDNYAENGPPQRPVFVSVLLADLPDQDQLADIAQRLCQAVSETLQRSSEQVHIVFQPAGRGRVAFGGRLLS